MGRRQSGVKRAEVSLRFFRSRTRRLPSPHTRGCLSPSTTDDGLQVSDNIVYMRLILTCDSSSTNARFIESLDSKYKPSIDRVQESKRDDSDDEDEDALFAELEAELENADSAALRGGGIKDMRAQFRRFSSVRPCTAQLTGGHVFGVGLKRSKPCNRPGMDSTEKSQTRKRLSERARESPLPSNRSGECGWNTHTQQ